LNPPLYLIGMLGFGDNLHQRAVLRELMKTHDVTLSTCHGTLYHDLVEQGLKLSFLRAHLRTQAKAQARERSLLTAPMPQCEKRTIGYDAAAVHRHGTILGAMFASVGLAMPARPDFTLPVPQAWREALRSKLPKTGKPIMVHRPVTLRREWISGHSRNPDLIAYDALYRAVAGSFYVISIADLEAGSEWIDGPPYQSVDYCWHRGELTFPELAALFAEAALVFSPAGMAPILAHAVGTPSVVVYGGHESFRTTDVAGAHLAPTLGIDPDRPCDCHSYRHTCDKRISLGPAMQRLVEFVKTEVAEAEIAPEKAVEAIEAEGPPGPAKASNPRWRPPGDPRGDGNGTVAIVVGGAANALKELADAERVCREAGEEPTIVAVNDMIVLLPGSVVAATLHYLALRDWLAERAAKGFPPPVEVWARWRPPGYPVPITHIAEDWRGSSGLFGVAVALQRGHRRVICVGVPMEPEARHVVRGEPWHDALRFRRGWEEHMPELVGRVRSMSGWTAGRLGVPDGEWLAG
jgi:ADP-heptose:LPS heptosyltransferase